MNYSQAFEAHALFPMAWPTTWAQVGTQVQTTTLNLDLCVRLFFPRDRLLPEDATEENSRAQGGVKGVLRISARPRLGFPGTDQEFGGIIKHGAKLLYPYCEATG